MTDTAWRTFRLTEVAERVQRRLAGEPEHVLMISSRQGFIPQDKKYSRFMAGESLKKYIELHEGEFAYNRGNSLAYPQGCIYPLHSYRRAAVPHVYFCFRVTSGAVSREFLDHYFRAGTLNPQLEPRINSGVRNNGLLNIKPDDFFSVQLLLPPLWEQQKIAAILSAVDNAIEATQAVIDQLHVVKNAMMAELLTRGLPGRHTRFKQTEIGETPEGWDVVRLSDISSVVRGSTPRPARDPRYFGGSAVPWITVGELSKDDWPYLSKVSAGLTEAGRERSRYLQEGTVVLSNSGYGCGVPKILQLSGCANDGIAAFLNLRRLEPLFLYYTLASMTQYLRGTVARGVEQPNLNTTLIGELHVRCPDVPEQRSVSDVLLALDARLRSERQLVEGFVAAKQSLTSALLTGELRVTPDEVAA